MNCDGKDHGYGWDYWFPLKGRVRIRRCRSPKGATRSGFTGLHIWQIVVGQRCSCCGQFYANAVALEKRTTDGIVLRCLRSKTYRTILILRRIFCGKPDDNQPTRLDGVGRRVGADCFPDKVGSSGWALHRALEELVRVEVHL